MSTGMLYTTFVDFVGGCSVLLVFWHLQKINRKRKTDYIRHLATLLLLYGILRVCSGTRIFFAWLNRRDLEMLIWTWITGPLTYIHLMPGFFFYGVLFFRKKAARLAFGGFFAMLILVTTFIFFRYGSSPGEVTYWGTKPIANPLAHQMFSYVLFPPALLCIIVSLIRRLKRWIKTKSLIERELFGFNLGLLIYALIGVFDALALARGWALLLVRTGIMVSALVIYLSATSVREEKPVVPSNG